MDFVMLLKNLSKERYRLISIDPGSRKMGLAVLELDMVTEEVFLISSVTYMTDSFLKLYAKNYPFGESIARQEVIDEIISCNCDMYRPHGFVAEDFYFQQMVTAFRSLTECMQTAKNAVRCHDPNVTFIVLTASNVKRMVGVKGTSGVKEEITEAILTLKDLKIPDNIDVGTMDEHSCDAIVIGYVGAKEILSRAYIETSSA